MFKMDVKNWTIFFVYLLSSSYIGMAVAQTSCRPNRKMEETFKRCFENVRTQLDDSITVPDEISGGVQMTGGTVSGLQNFQMKPPLTCSCFPNFVRIFIKLSFIDITVTFLVTLLDDLLGGLLGALGSNLARLVGQVVNLVVNILAVDITVIVAVDQRFIPGTTCFVAAFRVTRITDIRILNLNLAGLLGDILTPVVDTLLRNLLEKQVRILVAREISRVTVTDDMYSCGR